MQVCLKLFHGLKRQSFETTSQHAQDDATQIVDHFKTRPSVPCFAPIRPTIPASKYSNRRYLPKAVFTVSNLEALHILYVGTGDHVGASELHEYNDSIAAIGVVVVVTIFLTK